MNQPVYWRGEYKTVINGVELRVTTNGNGSGWRWIARRILDSKVLAASKPFPEPDSAKDEAARWLSEHGNGKAG